MKNQALLESHFCMKISKAPKHGKPTLYSLIAIPVLALSCQTQSQCVRFEKKYCFAPVVLNSFSICFYQSQRGRP